MTTKIWVDAIDPIKNVDSVMQDGLHGANGSKYIPRLSCYNK